MLRFDSCFFCLACEAGAEDHDDCRPTFLQSENIREEVPAVKRTIVIVVHALFAIRLFLSPAALRAVSLSVFLSDLSDVSYACGILGLIDCPHRSRGKQLDSLIERCLGDLQFLADEFSRLEVVIAPESEDGEQVRPSNHANRDTPCFCS